MSKKKRHFVGSIGKHKQKAARMAKDGLTPNEKELFALLKAHDYAQAVTLVPKVENVNAVDPELGMTALHWAAAHRVKGLLIALYARNDLNELALDSEHRYASDLAWIIAEDEELGAALMERERRYAEHTGQTAWPRPEPKLPG